MMQENKGVRSKTIEIKYERDLVMSNNNTYK